MQKRKILEQCFILRNISISLPLIKHFLTHLNILIKKQTEQTDELGIAFAYEATFPFKRVNKSINNGSAPFRTYLKY